MQTSSTQTVTITALALAVLLASLDGAPAAGPRDPTAVNEDQEVERVAAMIDAHIARRWSEANAVPAPPAADAEFCRRVHLAIGGRIPHVAEIRDYLDDGSPDKHRRLLDALLESSGYVTHFTSHWRRVLLPDAGVDVRSRFLVPDFEWWLRRNLLKRQSRFNELVSEILTGPTSRAATSRQPGASPVAFYAVRQNNPEELAAATSRAFLGVRLECAQCHTHPFDPWTREQFWSFAAFFAAVEPRDGPANAFDLIQRAFDSRRIAIPETDQVVSAAFLDATESRWDPDQSARDALARWVTSPENPWFARAAVNRIWGHLFGAGLVDPVDDFSVINPPSHPELLDDLAGEFVAHDCDLKFIIRAITASRTYRLSGRRTHDSQADPRLFARMQPQAMTPQQLVASLAVATGRSNLFAPSTPFAPGAASPRAELLAAFANDVQAPTERTTTILQALAMMNGTVVAEATDPRTSPALGALLSAPWLDTAGRIELLYLGTLSRPPRPDEQSRFVKYVESGGPQGDSGRALGDVLWALLNSSEFLLNH